MDKRIITLSVVLICTFAVLTLLWNGIKNIKIDDFHPAGVIFVVDSSASNQAKLPEQKNFIKSVCNRLDPEDQVKIIRVSEDAYLIYEGTANTRAITKSMNEFTQYAPQDNGTAYGQGLEKAFGFATDMKKNNFVPAIIVIGDLENEGATTKQVNWDTLPSQVRKVKNSAPDLAMVFVYAHPQKLDMVKSKLNPVLGEQKLILSPEVNAEKVINKFLDAIGR
ncbi:MAG: VWA domain-containing protein [bacterium]|nr:VWA domain-containing protein [bacterium]